jgi:hypothetical protein
MIDASGSMDATLLNTNIKSYLKEAYSLIKTVNDTATIGVGVFSLKHVREVVKLQTWNSSSSYEAAIDFAYSSGFFIRAGITPHYEALVLAKTMHTENINLSDRWQSRTV